MSDPKDKDPLQGWFDLARRSQAGKLSAVKRRQHKRKVAQVRQRRAPKGGQR